ncbi:hypothetical protein H6P81_006254 [Aristolochia fimbriata]|uniref:Uncharacterized protein n=1 Tax=Aristolochia fimbriata TaxID=158543 RepID=A0AAV7EWS8_ARIFI|nr:hypothetical protein H6P81_006254 [Aristolochia fimbriata]
MPWVSYMVGRLLEIGLRHWEPWAEEEDPNTNGQKQLGFGVFFSERHHWSSQKKSLLMAGDMDSAETWNRSQKGAGEGVVILSDVFSLSFIS